jgi:hypothetical protein
MGEDTTWKVIPAGAEGQKSAAGTAYTASAAEMYLPLIVRAGRSDLSSAAVVDRVWLQTWLSGNIRQDRAAFRFRTQGAQTTIELPYDLAATEIEALIDRKPAVVISRAPGRIVVKVPQTTAPNNTEDAISTASTSHTLELRSRESFRHNILTRHRLTPPQLDGSTALSQVYWQIVLPGDEHIAYAPDSLTAASQWQWMGSFWGRAPLKSQAELEEWIDSSTQAAPTDGQNIYLFTGLIPVSTIELVTAPRWLIVFAASGAVLLTVVALLYVPAAKRNWILAAIACALAVAALAYPTAAVLLAQAAAIGFMLSILAVALSHIFSRPPRMTTMTPMVSPSSQRLSTPRESILVPSVIAAASTAPTASLQIAESER